MPSLIALCVVLVLLWMLARALYRLFFHPLAAFPGPRQAAVSGLYEFYHDAIQQGRYFRVIEQMHEQYGENMCTVMRVSCRADVLWAHIVFQVPLCASGLTNFISMIPSTSQKYTPDPAVFGISIASTRSSLGA